ncbi:TIM barrel protein [Eubacteriales bacterium OttesenSCG-928-M02]|nr:TIM barrel protein [Eubacteriales bacterium OttesenSCG-928-M02]
MRNEEKRDRPLFGPAGNSQSFYDAGYKHTVDQATWLTEMGLSAYEYSFGHGVRMKTDTAEKIGAAFRDQGIAISCHAPYYINFGSPDPERREKSRQHLRKAVQMLDLMQGYRVVFHPGVAGKDREAAVLMIKKEIRAMLALLADEGYGHIAICPETMGKLGQIGDLEETMAFCEMDERLIPCIDFGHLYARSLGKDEGEEATCRILDRMEAALGKDRTRQMHVHFSNIEYTDKGEKRHHNYRESIYGPDFAPLATEMAKRELCPTIICESAGKMAEDALLFQRIYERIKEELDHA